MSGTRTGLSRSRLFTFATFISLEEGSSLVEVSLSFMLLLSVLMGIIGMSRLAYAKHFVSFAARQATRYALVRGATFAATPCSGTVAYGCQASATDVSTYVKSQIPLGLVPSNTTVVTTWPGTLGSGRTCLSLSGANSPGCVVRVTVSYNFDFGLPFLPSGVTKLQSTSAASILQ